MRIVAFDLSTKCIGCICAEVNDFDIDKFFSMPIIPPQYKPSCFLKSKKNLICGANRILSWAIQGETKITKVEKRKRDVQIRNEKDVFTLAYISKELNDIIKAFGPNIIIVEKNEIFNGILTSVLLAKVMGVLHGVSGSLNIPVKEYRVKDVRAPYNIFDLVLEFTGSTTSEELISIPDVTKRAIRRMLEAKYGVEFLTDDESDACLILDFYIHHDTYKIDELDWRNNGKK